MDQLMYLVVHLTLIGPVLFHVVTSEWPAQLEGIPSHSMEKPDNFSLNVTWKTKDFSQPIKTVLNFKKSEAVGISISIYKNDLNGKPYITTIASLRDIKYYQDIGQMAAVSLKSVGNQTYELKGSFMFDGEIHELEIYRPIKHKRSLNQGPGSYIITKKSDSGYSTLNDSIGAPHTESSLIKLKDLKSTAEEETQKHENVEEAYRRFKRQTLPDTTYIIELYIVVDFYLYRKLSESANVIGWEDSLEDYITYYISHTANEVDVRYRSINSSSVNSSYTWSIGTKLTSMLIATTGSESPWTYPSPSGKINSTVLISNFTSWYETNSADISPQADHVMLITSLDLTRNDGNPSLVGFAWTNGICGGTRTSVNEMHSSTVLAHELGHNLGAEHDGFENNCDNDNHYIMSASQIANNSEMWRGNSWIFSSCSIEYFNNNIQRLDSMGTNCLENDGSYISSWEDDKNVFIGQTIPLDEQCRLAHGDGYYFYYSHTGQMTIGGQDPYSTLCQLLTCTQDDSRVFYSRAALSYTSCGNKKWCVKEHCVSDTRAPEVDESCPVGDKKGEVYTNSDTTCQTVTSYDCANDQNLPKLCCEACAKFKTPWLGPTCPYGDKDPGCSGLNSANCRSNGETCCLSCCNVNGPATGYSCNPPTSTLFQRFTPSILPTSPFTTSSTPLTSLPASSRAPSTNLSTVPTRVVAATTPSRTVTAAPSTTITPTTTVTTITPSTATTSTTTISTHLLTTISTSTAPTTTVSTSVHSSTTPPTTKSHTTIASTVFTRAEIGRSTVTTRSTTPFVMTTKRFANETTSVSATPPTTQLTTSSTRRLSLKTLNDNFPSKSVNNGRIRRYKLYSIELKLENIHSRSFTCDDPDLQSKQTETYKEFHSLLCTAISQAVNKVTQCGMFNVTCGSLVARGIVEVAEDDSDNTSNAAPGNTEEFIRQAARLNDSSELELAEAPTAEDVNECAIPDLNDCSPNSNCSNTDGHYSCTCKQEYSKDLSEYTGRVCAAPCTPDTCLPYAEVCLERAESMPRCQPVPENQADDVKPTNGFSPLILLAVLAGGVMTVTIVAAIVVYFKQTPKVDPLSGYT